MMNQEMSENIATSDIFEAMRLRYEENGVVTDEDLDVIADTALTIIKQLLNYFGNEKVSIDEFEGEDGELIMNISGDDLAVLIGRHGHVLDSFSSLASSLLTKQLGFHYPITVDIENYRVRHREKLQSIAHSMAGRAIKTGRSVSLPPMSGYDRRLIHMALSSNEYVVTHSEGEDIRRHIVITPL